LYIPIAGTNCRYTFIAMLLAACLPHTTSHREGNREQEQGTGIGNEERRKKGQPATWHLGTWLAGWLDAISRAIFYDR
jgi:hypothetical protein